MTAETYLTTAIREATGLTRYDPSAAPGPNDRVFPVRVKSPQSEQPGGVPVPCVIYRVDDSLREDSIDGPTDPHARFFELDIRSATYDGVQNMATDIIDELALGGKLLHILSDYDQPDDQYQESGQYFSRIVEVGVDDGEAEEQGD